MNAMTPMKESADEMERFQHKLKLEEFLKIANRCILFDNHMNEVRKIFLSMTADIQEAAEKELEESQQMEADWFRLRLPSPPGTAKSRLTSLHGEFLLPSPPGTAESQLTFLQRESLSNIDPTPSKATKVRKALTKKLKKWLFSR